MLARILRSTIGQKVIMAITGLVMVGYLVTHVAANLLVFRGPELINAYAATLHSYPSLLWMARLVLIAALLLHVWAAVALTRRDRAARPTAYARKRPLAATVASRTIGWGGLAILFFLVYHVLHFTTGTLHADLFVAGDPHGNVLRAFRVPWVAALYVAAMVAVGLHLYHGTWSSFRSLGIARRAGDPLKHGASAILAAAIWIGFTVIPLAIAAGWAD